MGGKVFDWRSSFAVDLRSLALFRIAFGFCLFLDLTYRAFYIPVFYTDWGVLPRGPLLEQFLNRWEISLNLISGLAGVQVVLFLIAIFASLTFMVGYFTRVSAFVLWILVTSIQVRNQVVLHGGDDVIRLMLFWCQFVPLAAEFSFDKRINKIPSPKDHRFVNFGTAGIIFQVCAIYFFTALLKWHPIWHTEGSAVYYALSLDEFTSPVGIYLLRFPEFLRIMTFMTVTLEFFGPISAMIPFPLFNWRILVAPAFICFHLGLALTMELGLFPWVCMSAWLAFLPAYFWEKVGPISWSVPAAWLKPLKIPPPPRLKFSYLNQGVAAIFVVLILYWNMTSLEHLHLQKPQWMRHTMSLVGTYQKWSMFAPFPRKDDGWYVMEAEQLDGNKIDLWSKDHSLSFEKPANVADTYRNSLWRKYLTNLWLTNYNDYRLYLGRYLCRNWNTDRDKVEQVNTIIINYMVEMTPLPGQPLGEIRKEVIWRHYCFTKPDDWK
jgi:hypothetical protein